MNCLAALLLAAAAAVGAAGACAQTFAIVGGRVATGSGEPIDSGTVIVRDGRIAQVGAGLAPPAGATVIDARGGWVTPGLFAGFSRLGIVEVDGVSSTVDSRAAQSRLSAALDVAPAVNAENVNLPINRIAGITRAVVAPAAGNRIFAGQGAIMDLGADMSPVMRPRAFQYVVLGESGGQLAGGSRPAAFAELRSALIEARRGFSASGSRDDIRDRADIEALAPVVQGRQPLLVRANRAQDILAVLGLRQEFPALRLVLVDAREGWRVAGAIAAAKVPVITMALPNLPADYEQLGATQSNAGRLVRAGVTVALGLIDDNDARQLRLLPQEAGNLVAIARIPGATGLSHGEALATITRAPAEIFGLEGMGVLRAGAVGDVVVWNGDPLELTSRPTAVFVDGVRQPMTSRQTELRDRYLGLQRGERTLHYRSPAVVPVAQ